MDDTTRHFYAEGKGRLTGGANTSQGLLWSKAMPQHQQKLNIFAQKGHG